MKHLGQLNIIYLLLLLFGSILAQRNKSSCVVVFKEKTLEDSEDCTGYFAWCNNTYVQQYCPAGSKFDVKLGCCIIGKCPPCNCQETTTNPSASSTESISSTTEGATETASDITTITEDNTEVITEITTISATESTTLPNEDSTTAIIDTTEDTTKFTIEDTTIVTPQSTTDIITGTTKNITTESSGEDISEDTSIITSAPTTPNTRPTISPDICLNLPTGTFLIDPLDCGKYYVCTYGQAIHMSCPPNLWFDPRTNTCNYPGVVSCPQ